MSYVFVSFVGTQFPGVFQALAACLEDGLDLAEVHLHVSGEGQSIDNARKIRDWCEDKCVPVTTFGWDVRNTDPAAIAGAARATGHGIIFNLDGGMGYAVAGMMPLLDACQASVVACNSACAWIMALADGKPRQLAQPDPLPVRELLALQGIGWEEATPDEDLSVELRKAGQPKNSLEHVRIGSVFFDVVWNSPGNRIAMFANLADLASKYDNERKKCLAELRNLTKWAATRNESSHLYDREVHVLCGGQRDEQHVLEESRGKIKTMLKPFRQRDRQELFRQMFAGGAAMPRAKGSRKVEDDSLVLVLGSDVAPTMLAIASHSKSRIILCHTPDELACRKADRLRKILAAEGKDVKTLQTDISGTLLPGQLSLAGNGQGVEVNVTPGTKPQRAFLALWAARNGCAIWSVDSRNACLKNLQTGERRPTLAVDCLSLLEARYEDVRYGDVPEKDELHDLLLASMGKRLKGNSWNLWQACKGMGLDCARIQSEKDGDGNMLVISKGQNVLGKFDPEGAWLEGLAAYALRRAGARHLHTGVELPWPGGKYHRLEMDILATWESSSLMVSCKSMKLDATTEVAVAREAQSMAASVSRFAIPLVCCSACDKWHYVEAENLVVPVFGWRELCQPEILRKIIEETRQKLSTVKKEARA